MSSTELQRPSDFFNNEDSNTSANPQFDTVLQTRLSRRNLLRAGAGAAATAVLGAGALSGCATAGAVGDSMALPGEKLLGFGAVPKSLADVVSVPAGYKVDIMYALGDPILGGVGAFKNDGTDADFDKRAGDHHDGMEWFGLSASGQPSRASVDRGLLAMNHEATTDEKLSSFFIHANGGKTSLPRPAAEVDKEVAIHGISVVEVRKAGGKWEYIKDSAFNTRLTPLSEIEISGPARGNAITGATETPDGKALFINIQHPGETTKQADLTTPAKYTSQWPANAGYGVGNRPRSATIVITKLDGGRIGS